MSARVIDVRGRKVALWDEGAGAPLVYLHGFADIHAATAEPQAFHRRLGRDRRFIAPAHPGVGGTSELSDGYGIDDVVFHFLETFDALGLTRFDLVGHCIGGWIAAELATRHPEKVRSLALIGASGLFVAGSLIGDVFMHAQPERGVDFSTLRALLFADPEHPAARAWFPDGRAATDIEMRRYQMLRFGSFVGFRPPYFYNRALVSRLHRAAMPAFVLWGEDDAMVPRAHGRAYAENLALVKGGLRVVNGAGHSAPIEAPGAVAEALRAFLADVER